jgi:hypothetical protein
MDELRFERKVIENPYADGELIIAAIYINNKPLLDLVRTHELPYAQKYNQESIAGGYEYQFVSELYKQLTDKSYRICEEEVALMICSGCLEEGCWPLLVTPQEMDASIVWKDFYNPHRSANSAGGFWDYSKFGPFSFEKKLYYEEIEKLKLFDYDSSFVSYPNYAKHCD